MSNVNEKVAEAWSNSVGRKIAFELRVAAYTRELAAQYVKLLHRPENGRLDSCEPLENPKFEVVRLELPRSHG